jgi:outer membrane autotransporter protein
LRNLIQGTAVAATPYAGGPKPAAWISGYGDYERRDGQASFSFAGTNFSSNLGYRQGTAGVTGGIDTVWRGLATTTDGLVVGLLGGYTISRVELRDSPTTQEFSGPSAGIYATYLTGNWFFDSLFKVDLLSLDINTPGMSQSANLINYNLATNIGYRFDIPYHYYIEPTAGLEYVRTNFDHATALTATTAALNDGDALWAHASRPGDVACGSHRPSQERAARGLRSIDVHISRIRAAIEDDPKRPRRVITVRSAGYVFAKAQE